MRERLNLHVDETGSQDLSEGVYLVAVVLHEHADDAEVAIEAYEKRLRFAGLPDVPFHGKDLMHGNEKYRQAALSVALHDALEFVLASNVADFRDADHSARRLLQAAGYICAIERISAAYDAGKKQTGARERFSGSRSFMQPYAKQLARKRFG